MQGNMARVVLLSEKGAEKNGEYIETVKKRQRKKKRNWQRKKGREKEKEREE